MKITPQADKQDFHRDNPGSECYYTCIVPLTQESGGTEFKLHKPLLKTVNNFQYITIFNGNQTHRGTKHTGDIDRIFLFGVIYNSQDANEG